MSIVCPSTSTRIKTLSHVPRFLKPSTRREQAPQDASKSHNDIPSIFDKRLNRISPLSESRQIS